MKSESASFVLGLASSILLSSCGFLTVGLLLSPRDYHSTPEKEVLRPEINRFEDYEEGKIILDLGDNRSEDY